MESMKLRKACQLFFGEEKLVKPGETGCHASSSALKLPSLNSHWIIIIDCASNPQAWSCFDFCICPDIPETFALCLESRKLKLNPLAFKGQTLGLGDSFSAFKQLIFSYKHWFAVQIFSRHQNLGKILLWINPSALSFSSYLWVWIQSSQG